MRPLFFLIALGTTALTIAACKKPGAEVAPSATPPLEAAPPQASTAPTPAEALPGATTAPEGGVTTPQGGPPPVSPPQ